MHVPAGGLRACNQAPLRGDGEFVLCWMIADRVIARNARMSQGSEALWEYARSLIGAAVAQGHLAPPRP
jgi:hypothetical protein